MDYYVITATSGAPSTAAILAEEFVLGDDYTAAGIDTTAWHPPPGGGVGAGVAGGAGGGGEGWAG
ncbi:hypothetical protein E1295_29560, partial [Nonomuraea mesophila]